MVLSAVATRLSHSPPAPAEFLLAGSSGTRGRLDSSVSITYVSKFFPAEKQGAALGVRRGRQCRRASTSLPPRLSWPPWVGRRRRRVAIGLIVAAVIFFAFTKDDPELAARRASGTEATQFCCFSSSHCGVLRSRALALFSCVRGVRGASLWLPRYLIVSTLRYRDSRHARSAYSIPASLFRIYGGYLSDRVGAPTVMYWTFLVSSPSPSSVLPADLLCRRRRGPISFRLETGPIAFVVAIFVLGFFISLGKAARLQHVPVYSPKDAGAVGGLVRLIGGLAASSFQSSSDYSTTSRASRRAASCSLFLIVLPRSSGSSRDPAHGAGGSRKTLDALPQLPDAAVHGEREAHTLRAQLIDDWRPEDPPSGTAKARDRRTKPVGCRYLRCCCPLPSGWCGPSSSRSFHRSASTTPTDQLLLAGCAAWTFRRNTQDIVWLHGAGVWRPALDDAYDLDPDDPGLGIGFAVQDPQTPYWIGMPSASLCCTALAGAILRRPCPTSASSFPSGRRATHSH